MTGVKMTYKDKFLAFLMSFRPCLMPKITPATQDAAIYAAQILRKPTKPLKSVIINKINPAPASAIKQPSKAYFTKPSILAPFVFLYIFYHKVVLLQIQIMLTAFTSPNASSVIFLPSIP